MNKRKPFSLKERLQSFGFALEGLKDILITQPSAWIHSIITVAVLALAWWLKLDKLRWSLIVLAISGVWVTEAINTVLEILSDMVSPTYTVPAKRAKDMAAAAVFIAALGAAVLGLIILGPPLLEHLRNWI